MKGTTGAKKYKRDYSDMLELPHHISDHHPPMPPLSRAAQFAPFAALTGHHDAIQETARQARKRAEQETVAEIDWEE